MLGTTILGNPHMSSNNLLWSHNLVPSCSTHIDSIWIRFLQLSGGFLGLSKKQLWDALHLGLILWMMEKTQGITTVSLSFSHLKKAGQTF